LAQEVEERMRLSLRSLAAKEVAWILFEGLNAQGTAQRYRLRFDFDFSKAASASD
jgi:hypothetical protein